MTLIQKTCTLVLMVMGSALTSPAGAVKRPTVPFDAAIYATFVMPYPDFSRSYITDSLDHAGRTLHLNLNFPKPTGLNYLGTWMTTQALAATYGSSPAALILYTRDRPGPPIASTETAAVTLLVSRWKPSSTSYQTYLTKRVLDVQKGEYRRTSFNASFIVSSCRRPFFDYPVLAEQIKSVCHAVYATPKIYLDVNAINLGEQRAVAELKRVVRSIGAE